MKKELNPAGPWEDGVEYVGTQAEYHVRPSEAVLHDIHTYKGLAPVNTAILLKGRKALTLDFNGATLALHGRLQPFVLEGCEDITIRNVDILNDRAAFTEATIVESGEDFLTLRLNPHHPCRVEDGRLIPTSEYWENDTLDSTVMFLQCFDAETREGLGIALCMIGKVVHRENLPFNFEQYVAEETADGLLRLRGHVADCFRPGRIVALGHERRHLSTFFIRECRNIRLENVRILNGPGMGVMPIHSRDLYLDRVHFTHCEKSQGIITNHADALHTFACAGDLMMTDCIFEGMIDDAINVHSQFDLLEKAEGDRMTVKGTIKSETTAVTIFGAGDRIGVHRGKTTDIEAEYIVREAHIIDDDFVELVLDRPVAAHEPGSLVEHLSAQCDLTIRNCAFRKANTHLRIQTSGKVRIEDCEIALEVLLTGDGNFWFESSGVHDMVVRNTAFTSEKAVISIVPQVFPTENEPYYHKNIRIENCTFKNDKPIVANLMDNLVFRNNTQVDGRPMTLTLTNCGAVDAPGCILERHTKKIESLTLN